MFTRSVAHNWIAPIKSAEGCFPRRAHACFSPLIRGICRYICIYNVYIYMCVCIPSTVKIQYFTGADNLDGYAGSVFSSAVECRLVLRVYHYPITMVYEDVWLYFPGWNWRHNLPCQRKLLYRGGEEELPIYYRGGEEEKDGLLEAVTICQNELSLDWRVLAITHVKFEARGVFLETNSKIS